MKTAVIYGAGNIGRGFIGQLFSQSGYGLVFLDNNAALIDHLNRERRYPLRLVENGGAREIWIERVKAVNTREEAAAAAQIARADIMATAVGANVLPRIAPVIAKSLARRWQAQNFTPLNILICENLMDAHLALEQLLARHLDARHRPYLRRYAGLVEASVGRMVPVATPEMQEGNPARVWAEPYAVLPVDRDGFRGDIPDVLGMTPYAPFEAHIERKLYMHNMSHAVLAYLGRLRGHAYIWQAARDGAVAAVAEGALREASQALIKKHGLPEDELAAFSRDLMARFDNPMLFDTADRVGRDPVRKLGKTERLTGAAFACLEQGIVPENICRGITAALLFDAPGDAAAADLQASLRARGPGETLAAFAGIPSGHPLQAMILGFFGQYARHKR